MIRVWRGATIAADGPDVVAVLHVVLREAPHWETVEVRETIRGLNLTQWTDDDVLAATAAITPAAFDALRAVPSDPPPGPQEPGPDLGEGPE